MDTLNQVQDLRNEITRLKEQLAYYENGSRKSMLNCHDKGKKNFQGYIDLHYPLLETTGNYLKRLVDKCEPFSYEEIIGGDY